MEQPIVEVQNLAKQYPGSKTQVLQDVSFSIQPGELFGVLGVNGAGKSTLLNILIGLVTPTGGQVHMFGKNLFTDESVRERMNIATAYADLASNLTVRQNLQIYARMYNVQKIDERVAALLVEFKAEHLADKRVDQLSAGQKTRINLCKGFINEPELLLLDEPTASLDPSTAALVRTIIRNHQKKRGMTVILTSHNMKEVEEMCDRVALIQAGTIFRIDAPHELVTFLQVANMEEAFLKLAEEEEYASA